MSARSSTRRTPVRTVALVLVLAMLAAACGQDETPDDAPGDTSDETSEDAASAAGDAAELSVAIASFDLAVGSERRLLAGLFGEGAATLSLGEVRFELGYLGEDAGGQTEITQEATASFLPVPGWEPEATSDQPTFEPVDGRGVYAATVDLEEPGFWGLRVLAETDDGRHLEGQAVFNVAEQAQVPDVGDEAPDVANHTIEDVEAGEVAPVSLDSRAQEGTTVPDPHLHDTRIPDAIDDGWPVVVIASTPVYCRTNFCGPLVETLSAAAEEYADRAAFVHLEIYENFEEQRLNEAAAAWVQPADGSSGGEPWVFLVDGDGRIAARWDNVLDLADLRDRLDGLPSITAAAAEDGG